MNDPLPGDPGKTVNPNAAGWGAGSGAPERLGATPSAAGSREPAPLAPGAPAQPSTAMTAGPRAIAIATDCDSCHFLSFAGEAGLAVPAQFLALP